MAFTFPSVDPQSSIFAQPESTGTGWSGSQTFNIGGNPNVESTVQAAASVLTSTPWALPVIVIAAALVVFALVRR